MPPNEVPMTGTGQVERIQNFVIDQNEVPQALHRVDRLANGFAGAGMMWSINSVALTEPLDEGVPEWSAGRVQI